MIYRNCDFMNKTFGATMTLVKPGDNLVNASFRYDTILSKYPAYNLSLALYHYLLPTIIVFGTTGNVLSFIVMTGENLRNNSTCVFLAALAVFDTLVLVISGARYWLGKITNVDIKMLNDPMCKLFGGFLYHFLRHVSVWIVVGVTVDRFMQITFPVKTRSVQPKRRAVFGLLVIFAVLFVTDLTTVWSYEIVVDCLFKNGDLTMMTIQSRCYTDVFRNAWSWIDLCIYSFIPTTLLVSMNVRLMTTIVRRDRQKLRSIPAGNTPANKPVMNELSDRSKGSSKNPERSLTESLFCDEDSDISSRHLKQNRKNTTSVNMSRQNGNKKGTFRSFALRPKPKAENIFNGLKNVQFTTILPLIVSVSFIICTTPIEIVEILYAHYDEMEPSEMANVRLIRTSFFMLMYLNHSINLLLYCISGTIFRTELVNVFKRCRK